MGNLVFWTFGVPVILYIVYVSIGNMNGQDVRVRFRRNRRLSRKELAARDASYAATAERQCREFVNSIIWPRFYTLTALYPDRRWSTVVLETKRALNKRLAAGTFTEAQADRVLELLETWREPLERKGLVDSETAVVTPNRPLDPDPIEQNLHALP